MELKNAVSQEKRPPTAKLKCDICKRQYLHLSRLKRHIEAHMSEASDGLTCDDCQGVFKNLTKLQIHILKVHHDIEHRCGSCRRLFKSEDSMKRHSCQKQIMHRCPDCGKKFNRKYFFNKHRLTHSKATLRCKFCYTVFMKQETFDAHIAKLACSKSARCHWLETIDPKRCRICLNVFQSEEEMTHHFLIWHPGKIYKCYWCDKDFNSFTDLKNHVHEHIIERYTCRECNKAYTSQEGYRKHKLKHQNSAYKCQYCGKDYLSRSRAKFHEKSCTGKSATNTKLTRQLNWESRIISKKIRSADSEPADNEPQPFNAFLNDEDSLSDRQGWFDEYYNTKEDFTDSRDDYNDDRVSSPGSSSSETSEPEIDQRIDFEDKVCRICGDEFTFEYELLHHFVKVHPKDIPHQCPYCTEQVPLFAHLKEHLKTHGIGLNVFHCGNCSKAFRSASQSLKHSNRCKGLVEQQHGAKTCKCGKVFQTRCGYKRHKRFKCVKIKKTKKVVRKEAPPIELSAPVSEPLSPDRPPEEPKIMDQTPSSDKFPCRLCPMTFPYERGLVMHFKAQHPGEKPLICPHCGIALADKLKEHLKTHGIGEEFVCELCGKRFNQKFMSKIHEMWHEGVEYKCGTCKQKFLTEEKMNRHVAAGKCSNRMSLLKLPCDVCGKHYRSKFGLKTHYLTHTPKESRPVKHRMNCEFCGKWFENNNGLQRHRRIHTGEKPYCCRYCPKAFAQEGNCKAHERQHTGEAKPRRKKMQQPDEIILPFPHELR